MTEKIICPECPEVYPAEKIDVYFEDERIMDLASLRREGATNGAHSKSGGMMRRMMGMRPAQRRQGGPNLDILPRFRDYTFRCPLEHEVDGNQGSQFGIAVLGASGASKSHWLSGIVRETYDMSALRKAGVTLRDALYQNPQLSRNVDEVYRMGRQLEPTAPGQMQGPFGYRLMVRPPSGEEVHNYSLLLYDIAGEDLSRITRIVEQAPFILLCKALIILLDPVDFLPTQFDTGPVKSRVRLDAARDLRGGIQVIADTLAGVHEVESPRELDIPICFALAKADAIEWNGGFDWAAQTEAVLRNAAGEGDLRTALLTSSAATRDAIVELGGGLVVDEIEDCFRADAIRYVAASATSTMPALDPNVEGRDWLDDPEPNGVALSVLQALDAGDLFATSQLVAAA